jgi:hypothetical protein
LAATSDPATIRVLLDHKADVNPRGCVSVLVTAAQRQSAAAVEMLLAAGVRVEGDLPGPTQGVRAHSLMEFAFCSHKRKGDHKTVINLLLSTGMSTRASAHGMDALRFCLFKDNVRSWNSILPRLLVHDPGLLELRDHRGMTPILNAAVFRKFRLR